MDKLIIEIFDKSPLFFAERVIVKPWQVFEDTLASTVMIFKEMKEVLSSEVIKDLPDAWLELIGGGKIEIWLEEQKKESHLFAIMDQNNEELLGLLFLYSDHGEADEGNINLRLGYLLKESVWGQGIASELIASLVVWCDELGVIRKISGGVEENNIGSIKVLEKCGFKKSDEEMPSGVLLYTFEF